MSIWLPTLDQVILIHERLILLTGGADGIRDLGLVDSALARATASFSGVEAHPSLISKAAAICCGLTKNHGFIDGNKRIGITTMLMIMRRNAVPLSYTQDELIHLGLSIAQGKFDVPEVEAWLQTHISE
ncbi:MAG: type II toxin-antitoxin system death-on-curing family toxin [Clostridia bacterium]|nr:type II toxin-antitoxin system death-on-curing family toxin [Clostridia bacterium]